MSALHSFACLSKCIITKQVKFFNNLYGAACDHQYVRTAMPTLTKRMTVTRQISEEKKDWQKMELLKNYEPADPKNIPNHWNNPLASRTKVEDPSEGAAKGFIKHISIV